MSKYYIVLNTLYLKDYHKPYFDTKLKVSIMMLYTNLLVWWADSFASFFNCSTVSRTKKHNSTQQNLRIAWPSTSLVGLIAISPTKDVDGHASTFHNRLFCSRFRCFFFLLCLRIAQSLHLCFISIIWWFCNFLHLFMALGVRACPPVQIYIQHLSDLGSLRWMDLPPCVFTIFTH